MLKTGSRELVCSYSNWAMLRAKYPSRHVQCDVYAEEDRFYYYVPYLKGWRIVFLKDWSVWTAIRDENGWPTGWIKKIVASRL